MAVPVTGANGEMLAALAIQAPEARMLKELDLGPSETQIVQILERLSTAYRKYDAELLEINPLALLGDGRVVALDCKFVLDGAAVYRQPDLAKGGAAGSMTALEKRGAENGLKLIQLDGNVGVLANGAGLTMSLTTAFNPASGPLLAPLIGAAMSCGTKQLR